jgi:SAM-dependent methyltransferase
VLDVGCGTGDWLALFERAGVDDVFGVDGPHVPTSALRIPTARFAAHDLTAPLDLGRRFDLVICLEVAEHLPDTCADTFIDSLTHHGDLVLFSAAIPWQRGPHHVNEQWPSYWIKRFEERGYTCIDCVRPRVWNLRHVSYYYRQNLFFMGAESAFSRAPRLRQELEHPWPGPTDIVHPDLWAIREPLGNRGIKELTREVGPALVQSARRAIKRRLGARRPPARG